MNRNLPVTDPNISLNITLWSLDNVQWTYGVFGPKPPLVIDSMTEYGRIDWKSQAETKQSSGKSQ